MTLNRSPTSQAAPRRGDAESAGKKGLGSIAASFAASRHSRYRISGFTTKPCANVSECSRWTTIEAVVRAVDSEHPYQKQDDSRRAIMALRSRVGAVTRASSMWVSRAWVLSQFQSVSAALKELGSVGDS